MDNAIFNIPNSAPTDEEFIKEAERDIESLKTNILTGKFKETTVLKESMEEGGPASINEAILILMENLDIGIRFLSGKVKVPRKKLVRMIEGITPMPPEVLEKIYEVFAKKQPDLFRDIK